MPGMWIIVGGVVVLIALYVCGQWLAKKRREALAAEAARLGLNFVPGGAGALDGGLGKFHLFSQGHSKTSLNLMQGRLEDADARLFDYRYTTGSGKSSSTHSLTVAAFGVHGAGLPSFQMRPSVFFFDAVAAMVNHKRIEFPAHTGFAKKYTVHAADEAAFRRLFDDKLIEYFEAHPGWAVEAGGDWLLIYHPNRRCKPAQIGGFFEETFSLFGVFGVVGEKTAEG